MNFLLAISLFFACVSLHASEEFIPCKRTKECDDAGQCPVRRTFPFKLSQISECLGGVCSCKNKNGDFVAPKNCSEETQGSCSAACVKAAKSMSQCYIEVDNAYTCSNKCFCKFHLENLNKCKNNYDCGIDCNKLSSLAAIEKCKENAPPNYEADTRCDDLATCNTASFTSGGTCKCTGTSLGVVGSLSEKVCVDENVCLKLCDTPKYDSPSSQKIFKEKLCSIVVNKTLKNHCFCPMSR